MCCYVFESTHVIGAPENYHKKAHMYQDTLNALINVARRLIVTSQ